MKAARFLDRTTPPHIVTLVLLAALSTLAMNIFLPSLPAMARDFGVDYSVMQLSVSAYLAGSAVLQIVVGPISDRYGRRPLILAATTLFILASVAAALAPTAGLFLAARVVQAVIATGMALSRAVIRDMVPTEQAASMIGYVTMAMSVVPMVGPAVGGFLDEVFGWRSTFVLLVVLGLLTLWLLWSDLGETSAPIGRSLREQIAEYPALLRSPRFWGYAATASLASGSFYAYLGGAPFVGERVFGLTPTEVGVYFAAPGLGYALGNFFAGRYSVRIGLDRMACLGTLIATGVLLMGTIAALIWPPHPMLFFPFVGLMAVGNGMTLPNANAGLLSVRPHLAGSASGLGGALTIGGGAALAALSGPLMTEASGHLTLMGLMAACSALSSLTMILVIRRARRVGRLGQLGR